MCYTVKENLILWAFEILRFNNKNNFLSENAELCGSSPFWQNQIGIPWSATCLESIQNLSGEVVGLGWPSVLMYTLLPLRWVSPALWTTHHFDITIYDCTEEMPTLNPVEFCDWGKINKKGFILIRIRLRMWCRKTTVVGYITLWGQTVFIIFRPPKIPALRWCWTRVMLGRRKSSQLIFLMLMAVSAAQCPTSETWQDLQLFTRAKILLLGE